jgi:ketosteroid isomerase-like protein
VLNKTTWNRLVMIVFLIAGANVALAKDSRLLAPGERAELLRIRESIWNAWFNNDQRKLQSMLPEDTIAINNGEDAWQGRTEVIKAAQEFHAAGNRLVSLRFPKTEIQRYGDVIIYYSLFETVTELGGKQTISSGRATEVFVKENGHWVNSGWHLDSGK